MSQHRVTHEDIYHELGELSAKVDLLVNQASGLEPRVSSLEKFRAGCSAVIAFIVTIAGAYGSGHLNIPK